MTLNWSPFHSGLLSLMGEKNYAHFKDRRTEPQKSFKERIVQIAADLDFPSSPELSQALSNMSTQRNWASRFPNNPSDSPCCLLLDPPLWPVMSVSSLVSPRGNRLSECLP